MLSIRVLLEPVSLVKPLIVETRLNDNIIFTMSEVFELATLLTL